MDERGEVLVRAIESLRELPEVRPEVTARLLIAVAAERQRQREEGQREGTRKPRRLAWAAIAAAAVVVLGLSLLAGTRRDRVAGRLAVTKAAPTAIAAVSASNNADAASALRPVQFVFSAPQARSVRVVGDFNGWDDQRSPMGRDEVSGLWSVSVQLRPGRHVYAFVVNDTQWVRDPRATAAPDADFGRPGSVLLVGRP